MFNSRNPNEGPHSVMVPWPEYDSNTRQYMLLSPSPQVLVEDEKTLSGYNWWNTDFENIIEEVINVV